MEKHEVKTLENLNVAMNIASQYGFAIISKSDGCLELKATIPGFHYTTYEFNKCTSLRDLCVFMNGYDAAVKYLSKDSD